MVVFSCDFIIKKIKNTSSVTTNILMSLQKHWVDQQIVAAFYHRKKLSFADLWTSVLRDKITAALSVTLCPTKFSTVTSYVQQYKLQFRSITMLLCRNRQTVPSDNKQLHQMLKNDYQLSPSRWTSVELEGNCTSIFF